MRTKTHERAVDDVAAYMATLSPEERELVAEAGLALDLHVLLFRSRDPEIHGVIELARDQGWNDELIGDLKETLRSTPLESLRAHLDALGFELEIGLRYTETGELLGRARVDPVEESAATPSTAG
jgi:hypothetical protein